MTEAEIIDQIRLEFFKKLDDPNFIAKIIAAYVRNNLEEFHGRHLNDRQMAELNPLIRNAIYTALIDIGNRSVRVVHYAGAYVTGKIANIWISYKVFQAAFRLSDIKIPS